MTKTKMSLHRVIAEIKATEALLATIPSTQFVYKNVGEGGPEVDATVIQSQRAYDRFQSAIANLATLKAARNAANSVVNVSVGGVTMTIDQALSAKAALPFKQSLINTLTLQFTRGQQELDAADAKIETMLTSQIAAAYGATKKATEEEIAVFRKSIESRNKATLVHAIGLKDRIDSLKAEVAAFTTEIDYVLSEANATNTVEVQLV